MYASTQAFECSLFSGSILKGSTARKKIQWWDLALKAIVVYNFIKLLKKILPQTRLFAEKL